MTEREINPLTKTILELGPPILFFVLYLRIRDETYLWGGSEYSGFIVATIAFVPIMLIAIALLWWQTGKLSRMQVFTAFMVIFFGALTAYFNDERFFKLKTTLVYGVFAMILGIGLVQGKSYLAYVLDEMMPMRHEGWMKLTRRLALAFLALAVTNEVIWRTMSTDVWVKIETFGFPIALFLFLWSQIMALQSYVIEADPPQEDPKA